MMFFLSAFFCHNFEVCVRILGQCDSYGATQLLHNILSISVTVTMAGEVFVSSSSDSVPVCPQPATLTPLTPKRAFSVCATGRAESDFSSFESGVSVEGSDINSTEIQSLV